MDSANATESPQRLGDFEILREIGRGGMGMVYEARQRSLNRRVALKVLSTGLGLSTKAIMRFKREAEAAARLHHTNIVPVYATGEENRVPYYVMELVEGPSLDQVVRQLRSAQNQEDADSLVNSTVGGSSGSEIPAWVAETIHFERSPTDATSTTGKTGPITDSSSSLGTGAAYFDSVARMMAEVADALAHAHDQGVIHRDIKPSNLLLSPDGRLSVNDFGLARMLEQPGMTISGEFMGSPLYMSPEQITAGRAPLDHRTDIYSLGATLYQLLTLQPPFPARQRDQVIAAIMHKEPVRPRKLNGKVPMDLETICLKALEKDPDRRYQTADLLAEDLRRFVSRNLISARRVGPVGRAVRWCGRHRALATSIACVVLLVIVAGASLWWARAQQQLRAEEALTTGRYMAMSGDFNVARKSLQRARALSGPAGEIALLEGLILLNEGDAGGARERLQQAMALLPETRLDVRLLLASAQQALGRFEHMGDTMREIERLGLEPGTVADYIFMATLHWLDDPSQALTLLEEGVTLEDSGRLNAVARLVRANIHTEIAKDRGSLKAAQDAANLAEMAKFDLQQDNALVLGALISAYLTVAMLAEDSGTIAERDSAIEKAKGYIQVLESDQRLLGLPAPRTARFAYYAYLAENGEHDAIQKATQIAQEESFHGLGVPLQNQYVAFLYGVGELDRSSVERFAPPDADQGELESSMPYVYVLATYVGEETALTECRRQIGVFEERESVYVGPMYITSVHYLLGRPEQEVQAAYQRLRQGQLRPHVSRTEWYRTLLSYNCGEIDESQLMESAGDSRYNQCEGYFFIGLKTLARGNRDAAREALENCVKTRIWHWADYQWSRAFLRRLDDPKWAPWRGNPQARED